MALKHRAYHRRPGRPWMLGANLVPACLLAGLATPLAVTNVALGQAAAPASGGVAAPPKPPVPRGSPATVVGSVTATAINPTQAAAIRAFVQAEVAALVSGDPAVGKSARETLERAAVGGTAAAPMPASPAYQQAFAAAVAGAVPSALKTGDVRARVNLAVTLARLTGRMQTADYLPAVLAVLADKAEPVVMGGLRAARTTYPYVLAAPGRAKDADALAAAVTASMRAFPKSDAIAEDAFDAIGGPLVTGPAPAAPPALAVNHIIALVQARAQLFAAAQQGALPEADPNFPAMPPPATGQPSMENGAMSFLALTQWRVMAPRQQQAAGRAMFDLASEMNRLAPLIPARAAGDQAAVRQNDLSALLNQAAAAIQVAGTGSRAAAAITAQTRAITDATRVNPANYAAVASALPALEQAMTTAGMLGPRPAAPAPAAAVPGTPATRPTTGTRPADGSPAPRPGTATPAVTASAAG